MSKEAVRAYYAGFVEQEKTRLERPDDGTVEFILTTRQITKYVPPGSRILDIGGGPGTYAFWLAEYGYQVVLADLSPELLEVARARKRSSPNTDRVEAILEADACDLSAWVDGTFDAVLSLGPFYHLTDAQNRAQAARELVRVLKPSGYGFVALMPVFAFLCRTLANPDERHHLGMEGWLTRLLERGEFTNTVPGRFNAGYGVRVKEVSPYFEGFGLETVALLSAESIVVDIQKQFLEARSTHPALYPKMLELVEQVAADPSILGMANHLLYVGRKA